jgi:alkanesulfonate monooxygenase SsuD/methylene tetrahydromethanopterin reductase-like flavin-dependent oxidoreductase (luciferase family)
MRFGLLQEGDTPKGMTHYHRYHEIIKEVQVAEEVGFDFWGTSEQHFLPTVAPISAPETLYAAVAMKTSRIKLRHMSVLMLQFNHPIRIAERLATLDILSNGRVELSTARSNSHLTLNPFQVPAQETREQWRETLEVVIKALTQAPFEHKGKMYEIPPTTVTPRLYRDSLFPVSVIASSPETFELAGKSGLGVITNDTYLGWEWLQQGADIYKAAIADNPQPFAPYTVNNSLGFSTFTSNCDTNRQRAVEAASHIAKGFFQLCYEIYTGASGMSDSYQTGIGRIVEMADRRDDLDFMMEHTPSVLTGTPDDFIEKIKKLESLGYDEVILRIDGFGHEQNRRAIELVGKYVIPEFKAPRTPVRPSEYEELGITDVPANLI